MDSKNMTDLQSIERTLVEHLKTYGDAIALDVFRSDRDNAIEINFEPHQAGACGGSITIMPVKGKAPWVSLHAGVGLEFEWYEGCAEPRIESFLNALSVGDVRENVSYFYDHFVGSSGYVIIGDEQHESVSHIGIYYLLSKVFGKIQNRKLQYKPWLRGTELNRCHDYDDRNSV
jgi:hypothetical protein